ncbi:MAG: hypothetical protein OEU54_06260 [Gemmatimonadota bacterium]|nr:hypothetical protein [Gemmatimonadota bacterium]
MSEQPSVFRRGLVEFVVIVFGVLMALALESWWQGQQDAALAEEYLESLRDEARAGVSIVENVSSVTGLKRRWLTRANAVYEAGLVADSPAVFLEGALQGSGIPVVPQLSDAVFEDLQSTGRLSLFDDAATRREIISGYTNIQAMLQRQASADVNIGSRLHALASRYAPVGAFSLTGPRVRYNPDGASLASVRQAAIGLSNDPQFAGQLRAAFRALDHEENVLGQLLGVLQEQLIVLEGGERPQRPSFRDLAEAEAALEANRSGSTDSSGTR